MSTAVFDYNGFVGIVKLKKTGLTSKEIASLTGMAHPTVEKTVTVINCFEDGNWERLAKNWPTYKRQALFCAQYFGIENIEDLVFPKPEPEPEPEPAPAPEPAAEETKPEYKGISTSQKIEFLMAKQLEVLREISEKISCLMDADLPHMLDDLKAQFKTQNDIINANADVHYQVLENIKFNTGKQKIK